MHVFFEATLVCGHEGKPTGKQPIWPVLFQQKTGP